MNIKKQLKENAEHVLPDERIKEEIKYRLDIGEQAEVDQGKTKAKLTPRRQLVIAAACLFAAAVIVCSFIPLMTRTTTRFGGVFGSLSSAEEIYGFSAATAGIVISGLDDDEASAYTLGAAAKNSSLQIDDEETVSKLNRYMELVESLISGGNFSVSNDENSGGRYDDYAYVMHVSYTDLLGATHESGTIYYNRTNERTEYDGDEVESTYTLEGIMVLDGTEYPLYGTHESESEGDESESEYEMYVYLGTDSYLLVEQSVESEDGEYEIEYSYSLTENGRRISRVTFEYESEDGETELVMTVRESDGTTEVFAFESDDGEIVIRYGGVGGNIVYTVEIKDGQYVYYREGQEIDRGNRR